ncbi:MAG: hypothetical protein CFK52_08830 [Chloracidobacterium sp. CP2_5A]|nr:MAG: hypothetical protein CFK52_08830 [Chloracidobacterium sp. CP2_5A]
MTEWLAASSALESLCWGVALFSTALLVMKLLLGSLLDGLDGHFDGSFDLLGGAEPVPSGGLKAILAGCMVTGWSGVLCFQLTRLTPLAALGAALGAGFATFLATAWILRQVYRIESDGTLQPANAIGRFGTVYLTIPAGGQGSGQVQIEVQGRLATLDAITDGPAIPTGLRVFVHSVSNGVLAVVPESALGASRASELTPEPPPLSDPALARHKTLASANKELPNG